MEKVCEFCNTAMPMVYCHADAAYLCLSCDAKVHSANDVSNRHHRALLCDSCRHLPACVRCFDHRMFICRSCDSSLHGTTQHRKRSVSSYVGCPTANDFAALCGFELNDSDRGGANVLKSKGTTNHTPGLSESGSMRQQFKWSFKGQHQEDASFIWKQIMDLKILQLTEMGDVIPSTVTKLSSEKKNDINSPSSLLQADLPFQELKEDNISALQFLQSDSLPFASTSNLFAEPFWQWKTPDQNGQLWSQTMSDLDVCGYVAFQDDFDIPDVDTSFSNFEELFKGDDENLVELQGDRNFSCSSTENKRIKQKPSPSSSRTVNLPREMQQLESIHSSTASIGSCESPGTEYSAFMESKPPFKELFLDADGENVITKYKDKRRYRRSETRVLLSPRRAKGDTKKRTGGLFLKPDCYDSDTNAVVSRSY